MAGSGIVLAAFVVALTGCSSSDGDESASAPTTVTITETATATVTAEPPAAPPPSSTPPASPAEPPPPATPTVKPSPKGPPARIPGEGTFLVGRDVAAGTYHNAGPSPDDGRYCVVFTSTKPNDLQSYLRGSTSKGPAIITVNKGEYVNTQFCKPFALD